MGRSFVVRLLVPSVCLASLLVACFGPIASPTQQLAYRDFSDFYYPLYQKVQQEWDQGRLPLWSSGENCGSPLLGNPTAAVLYPGKLIYAILPYPWAAKAYIVAHVLLAFATMTILLRGWEVSASGAALGGLAYAFGAPVLTQYSNVVFLVGASWMPLGLCFADRWVRLGKTRGLAGLAFVLAMQVLGGDPEAAYLTAFASAAYTMGRWVVGESRRRVLRISLAILALLAIYGSLLAIEVRNLTSGSWWLKPELVSLILWSAIGVFVFFRRRTTIAGRLLGLAGACGLAIALSGAQLVPCLEFIAQSSRTDASKPVDIYQHSIHPARVIEWIWPNAFGATFGQNRNWLTALPPTNDHNVWMTSITLGTMATLLAAGSFGFRGGSTGRGWMIGLALVGVLGGFGDYASPIFWARTMPGGEARFGKLEVAEPILPREDGLLRDGDGGVYWFLSSILPGFRSFRFPGKLFIPAALGISALAGMGLDAMIADRRKTSQAIAWTCLVLGLAGLGFVMSRPGLILRFLEGRADLAKSAFGPFDPVGAMVDLRLALIHGSIVAACFLGLGRLARFRPVWVGPLALVLISIDLAIANHGQLGTVAQSAYEGEPRALAAILKSERDEPEPGPYRVFRIPSWPLPRWIEEGSKDRLEEIVRWERDTLRSKYEQPLGVDSTFAYSTAELAEIRPFFEPFQVETDPSLARRLGIAVGKPIVYFPRRGFDIWNTRYFILPTRLAWNSTSRGFASLLSDTSPIYPERSSGPDAKNRREAWGRNNDFQVIRNRNALPRAWVVHRANPIGPTSMLSDQARDSLISQLIYQDDELWHVDGQQAIDPRAYAFVEATVDQLRGLSGSRNGFEPVIVHEDVEPSHVELEVNLASPGLVILADSYYPGWTLEIDGQPAEILRTNRAMRGAVVSAGTHRLIYTYRPKSLKLGTIFSAIGLMGWLVLLAIGARSGRALKRAEVAGSRQMA